MSRLQFSTSSTSPLLLVEISTMGTRMETEEQNANGVKSSDWDALLLRSEELVKQVWSDWNHYLTLLGNG